MKKILVLLIMLILIYTSAFAISTRIFYSEPQMVVIQPTKLEVIGIKLYIKYKTDFYSQMYEKYKTKKFVIDECFRSVVLETNQKVTWYFHNQYNTDDNIIILLINKKNYYILPRKIMEDGSVKVYYKDVIPDNYYMILYKLNKI